MGIPTKPGWYRARWRDDQPLADYVHEFPVCVNVRDVSHRGLNMPGLAVYSFRSFMLGLNGWLPLEVIAEWGECVEDLEAEVENLRAEVARLKKENARLADDWVELAD